MRETHRVKIVVLGSVTVLQGENPVDLGPRLRRLLAALAVADGDVVSMDKLVDVVWEGEPPAKAERTLRTYVTRLRKALAPGDRADPVAFREPGYALVVGADELDARLFEAELEEATGLLRAAEVGQALALVDQALSRWRGAAFAGFADEDWCRPEAVRLERRRAEAKALRAEAYLAAGDHERAVSEAEALVAADPLGEAPRDLLMRALYGAGRQAEALRVLPAFRRLLSEELGLDPSEDLVELETRIARRDPTMTTGGVQVRDYALGDRLGEGAFAVVHRGVQASVDREVAVKIIRPELADRADFIRRFESEAKMVARLEHPHIVPVHDFWREPGAAYIVMRLMRGGSVEQALRTHGPYSMQQVVDLLSEIGPALEVAHRAGVVHRDIKPGNILLDEHGHGYLSDFGIATRTETVDSLTVTSPAYAAPEQLRGEPVGATADILSLGVTVFEMLTGRLPFAESTSKAELVQRQLEAPIPPVQATRRDLPAALDEVLARATAKAAGDRYSTVSAFVGALGAALERSSVPVVRRATGTFGTDVAEAANPYVGLHAFDEPDADRFHGREAVVARLVDRVAAQRFVALVGPSGSGKSSIVRAGAIPALRGGGAPGSDSWFITTMLPGRDPFDALETALLRVAVNPPTSLREQLAEPGGLLRAVMRVLPTDRAEIVIVVDQLEELFTQSDPATTRRFFDELSDALRRDDCPLRIVATLRADHYDAPLRHGGIAGLVSDGTVTVPPMRPEEVERAIVAPAAAVGVEVEPALVAELVASVADRSAALPLLQFSLTETFERRVAGVMTLDAHQQMGGLTGALAARADRVLGDDEDEDRARRLFGRLVTLGEGIDDTRRRAPLAELDDDERTTWLIDGLVKARLLTVDRDPATRAPTVEVAHEALLRDWPRLRVWLDDDRADLRTLRQVTASSDAWHASGQDAGDLGRGLRLQAAEELGLRRPDLFNDDEQAWLTASLTVRDREAAAAAEAAARDRRQNRRLRSALAGAAVLLVVALIATLLAFSQRQDANAARDDAEIERLVAESAAQSFEDPGVAMLLAVEANRRRDDAVTRGALQAALVREPRLEQVFGAPMADALRTEFSADGSVGVSWTLTQDEGSLVVFDPVTGDPLSEVLATDPGVRDVAVSGEGRHVAVALTDGTVRVLGTDTMKPVAADVVMGDVVRVALDGDGDMLVVLSDNQPVVAVDVASGETLWDYSPHGHQDGEVHIDPEATPVVARDGSAVAIAVDSGIGSQPTIGVVVLDAVTGEEMIRHLRDHSNRVDAMAFGADGSTLVTGGRDGTVFLYDALDRPAEPVAFSGHTDHVTSIAVSDDGDHVLTGSHDGTARLWRTDGSPVALPYGAGGRVDAVSHVAGSHLAVSVEGGGHQLYREAGATLLVRSFSSDFAGLSPDGEHFATGGPGGTAEIRLLADGELVHTFASPDGKSWVPFGRWSADGDSLLLLAQSGSLWLHEIATGRRIDAAINEIYEQVLPGDPSEAQFVPRVHVDGEMLLLAGTPSGDEWVAVRVDLETDEISAGPLPIDTGGFGFVLRDGRAVVGDPRTPMFVLPAGLDGPPLAVESGTNLVPLAEDPVSGLVAVGGGDGVLGLLDPDTGRVEMLEGLAGEALAATFLPTGGMLAVGTSPDGVQLFDMATGTRVGLPMQVEGDNIASPSSMVWDPSGEVVWWVAESGVQSWIVDPDRWVQMACEIAGREFTEVEWRTFVSDSQDRVDVCA